MAADSQRPSGPRGATGRWFWHTGRDLRPAWRDLHRPDPHGPDHRDRRDKAWWSPPRQAYGANWNRPCCLSDLPWPRARVFRFRSQWVAGWRFAGPGQVHEIRQGRRSGPPSRGRPPSRAAGLDAPGPEPCRRTGAPSPSSSARKAQWVFLPPPRFAWTRSRRRRPFSPSSSSRFSTGSKPDVRS